MLKWLGASLILSGAIGTGLWKKKQLYERVMLLRELEKILLLMKSEISYGQVSFVNVLVRIMKDVKGPIHAGISRALALIKEREGENIILIFAECMKSALAHTALKDEDMEIFLDCFSGSSFHDHKAWILLMEREACEIHKKSERSEKEAMAGGRIAIAFGGMVGMAVVVILL